MKGTWVKAVLMLLVCLLVSAPALADETKWVRGKATAVGGDSITVEVMGKPMTFKFDAKTDVVAPGGGTATRAAQAAGHTGTSLASVVKVGDGVEVHYTEAGGVMMATEIRGGIPVTGGGAMSEEKTSGKSVNGTVKAVTDKSLTIVSKGQDWTFMPDAKTAVVGVGIGTMARAQKAAGEAMTLSKGIGVGDEVTVSYEEVGGMKHIREVRVRSKAAK